MEPSFVIGMLYIQFIHHPLTFKSTLNPYPLVSIPVRGFTSIGNIGNIGHIGNI